MYKYTLLLLVFFAPSCWLSCESTSRLSIYNDQINLDEFQNKCIVMNHLIYSLKDRSFAVTKADDMIDVVNHAKLTCLDLNDLNISNDLDRNKQSGIKRFLRNLNNTYVDVVNFVGSGITTQSLFKVNAPDHFIEKFKKDIENLININGKKIYVYFDGEPMPFINYPIIISESSDESGDEMNMNN